MLNLLTSNAVTPLAFTPMSTCKKTSWIMMPSHSDKLHATKVQFSSAVLQPKKHPEQSPLPDIALYFSRFSSPKECKCQMSWHSWRLAHLAWCVVTQLGGARGSRLAKDGWIVSVVEASEVFKVRRLQTAETSAYCISSLSPLRTLRHSPMSANKPAQCLFQNDHLSCHILPTAP